MHFMLFQLEENFIFLNQNKRIIFECIKSIECSNIYKFPIYQKIDIIIDFNSKQVTSLLVTSSTDKKLIELEIETKKCLTSHPNIIFLLKTMSR